MMKRIDLTIITLGLGIFLMSLGFITYNAFNTHFIGNPYIQPQILNLSLILILMLAGSFLLYGRHHYITCAFVRLSQIYICLCLIGFLTTAIQYTPYPTIDHHLVEIDKLIFFNTTDVLARVHQYPYLVIALEYCYATLPQELWLVFLLVFLFEKNNQHKEFFFLIFFTALVGFGFYYFFPTTAPASMFHSPYFITEQYETYKKFHEIHQGLQPSTFGGGMIAFPSFHCIWALCCQYYFRSWSVLFYAALPLNIMITTACVLLGWHYLIDVIAAIFLFLCSVMFYKKIIPLMPEKFRCELS